MAGQDPSPQTTLLILLGASSWPRSELRGSAAFENAVRKLRAYFLSDPNGFHLPRSNVLDLFNSDDSNTDLLNQTSNFLSERIAMKEKSSTSIRDLLIYYISHGGITKDSSTFYLAIRDTRKDYEKATSLAIDDLAERLKKGARFQRRILILDCCFAAQAMRFLQGSAPATLVREKTVAAFKEIDQGVGIPSRGTSFLASSGKDVASVILPDETSTMFTSALLSALRAGDPFQERERLTLYTVYRLTEDFLRRTHRDNFPQPELHSPDQSEGDIATTIPLFPNPRAEQIRARRAEEERRRLAEEAEHIRRMEEEKQRRIEEERARQAEEERLRKAREEEQASQVKQPEPEPELGPVAPVSETTDTNQSQQPTEMATTVPVIPSPQQPVREVSADIPAQSQTILPLSGREHPPQPAYPGISRRTVIVSLAGLAVASVAGGGLLWLTHSQQPAAPPASSTPTSTSKPRSTPTSHSVETTLYTYRGHSAPVKAVAWSPDSNRIASGSEDQTVQVWQAV